LTALIQNTFVTLDEVLNFDHFTSMKSTTLENTWMK